MYSLDLRNLIGSNIKTPNVRYRGVVIGTYKYELAAARGTYTPP